jgi:cell division protein FtsL
MRFCLYITMITAVLMFTGCASTGILYTHVTTPLDTNMSHTPSGVAEAEGEVKELALYVSALWDSNAIGDVAKEHGMEIVYYADLEILRILGIWSEYTVHVYGK